MQTPNAMTEPQAPGNLPTLSQNIIFSAELPTKPATMEKTKSSPLPSLLPDYLKNRWMAAQVPAFYADIELVATKKENNSSPN